MRKIEKETLQIINSYRDEEYLQYKKLESIRENEIKENLEKELEIFMDKESLLRKIESFKLKQNNKVSINFDLSIRTYYTDYNGLYEDDKILKELKEKMHNIEIERNKMKLILQNSEIKSLEYKNIIDKLKKGK